MPRATLTRTTRATDSTVIELRATGKYPRNMAAWIVKYRARPIGVHSSHESNEHMNINASHREKEWQFRIIQQWHQAAEHTFPRPRKCRRWLRKIVEQGLYIAGKINFVRVGLTQNGFGTNQYQRWRRPDLFGRMPGMSFRMPNGHARHCPCFPAQATT